MVAALRHPIQTNWRVLLEDVLKASFAVMLNAAIAPLRITVLYVLELLKHPFS